MAVHRGYSPSPSPSPTPSPGPLPPRPNPPLPSGWKPTVKAEAIEWLRNLQTQLSTIIDSLEDSPAQAQVYVAQQITQKVTSIIEEGA